MKAWKPLKLFKYAFVVTRDGKVDPKMSFRFDSSQEGLSMVGGSDERIPWMILEYHLPPKDGSWTIEDEADIPPEVTKWKCLVEDCECDHCIRCGCHYLPECSEGNKTCDGCQLDDIRERTTKEVKSCGGDTNEAAKRFGWERQAVMSGWTFGNDKFPDPTTLNKAQRARVERLLPGGIPRYMRVYDHGRDSGLGDPITIVFTGNYRIQGLKRGESPAPGGYAYISANSTPTHPAMGFYQHGEHVRTIDTSSLGWAPAVGRKHRSLGWRIKFEDLPEAVRNLAVMDYCELWGLPVPDWVTYP